MRRLVTVGIVVLATPVLAFAHVSVRPRESKPNVEERYIVRAPTEGAVATTHELLVIPVAVKVLEVPATGDVVWKAHQHFSDGTTADWVGVAGEKRPASVTRLAAAATGAAQITDTDAADIEAWLKGYDTAFNAKDLDKLATFYHPDVTIYEGGGINNGWADYRDRHLGPELKSFENLQFGHSNAKVTVLPGGQSAYVTSEYSIKAKMGEREIDSRGLETLVLIKAADGSWKIRHSHTSSRPARRPAA